MTVIGSKDGTGTRTMSCGSVRSDGRGDYLDSGKTGDMCPDAVLEFL